MIQDKRGLSAIVMTVIMVGLVLVAVGIVWVVVLNILEGQSESLDYDQQCLGLNFEINSLSCAGDDCNLSIERKTGSKGDPIDGVAITFSNPSASGDEVYIDGNIAASKTITDEDTEGVTDATRADARSFFYKNEAETERHFCSQIFNSE